MSDVAIVIPCFNEAIRFKTSEADRLLDNAAVRLVFVNDGSTDQTQNVLSEFRDRHRDRVTVINFEIIVVRLKQCVRVYGILYRTMLRSWGISTQISQHLPLRCCVS